MQPTHLTTTQSAIDLASNLQRQRDELADSWNKALLEEKEVPCAAGCFACCSSLVLTTLFEGVVLAKHLQDLEAKAEKYRETSPGEVGAPSPDAVDTKVRELRERYRALVLQGREQLVHLEQGGSIDEWYTLHRPCSLLDPRGYCSIYPVRPAPCSTYWVTSDPAFCAQWGREDREPVSAIKNRDPKDRIRRMDLHFLNVLFLGQKVPPQRMLPMGVSVQLAMVLLHSGIDEYKSRILEFSLTKYAGRTRPVPRTPPRCTFVPGRSEVRRETIGEVRVPWSWSPADVYEACQSLVLAHDDELDDEGNYEILAGEALRKAYRDEVKARAGQTAGKDSPLVKRAEESSVGYVGILLVADSDLDPRILRLVRKL